MAKFPFYSTAKRLEKLSRKEQEDLVFDLINAFALVKDPWSSALLLQDLLTAAEIKNLSKRLRIAKRLIEGETQREIASQLHCSLATTAKVKAWLDEAGEGLKQIISRLPKPRKWHRFKKDVLGYYGLPQIILGTFVNTLKASEKERLISFMENVEKKKQLYKEIQKLIDDEFREAYHQQKRSMFRAKAKERKKEESM